LESPELVVGIGASAGGIGALTEFFKNVPLDAPVAYVVILHLSPDHESRLAEVLQRTTALPMTQVRDTVPLRPRHAYVIPPNRSLRAVGDTLQTSEALRVEERKAPIDIFFRTLADVYQTRAVAVVLSGTGADGSMGLKRVKEMDGLTVAQQPEEAEHSEMPQHAIATTLVDYVLPAAEIPAGSFTTSGIFRKHAGAACCRSRA
jgi:chemotaxis response regulator CheB